METSFGDYLDYYMSTCKSSLHLDGQEMQVIIVDYFNFSVTPSDIWLINVEVWTLISQLEQVPEVTKHCALITSLNGLLV